MPAAVLGDFHLDAALFNFFHHFRSNGFVRDEHAHQVGSDRVECRAVCDACGRHGDDYLGILGDDASDEFGLKHVFVPGAMLGGVAVRGEYHEFNVQGSGRMGRVLAHVNLGFTVETAARAVEAEARDAFQPGQKGGVVGDNMRVSGVDMDPESSRLCLLIQNRFLPNTLLRNSFQTHEQADICSR